MSKIEKATILDAYEDVRDDKSATSWLVLKYQDNCICLHDKGDDYEDLKQHLSDDDRAFAFVRVTMGDELSKRAKFAFITWVGSSVNGMKKAKLGPDKSVVKSVIKSFAVEIMASELDEVDIAVVKDTLLKAGGANYGTGK